MLKKIFCTLLLLPFFLKSQESKVGQWYVYFGNLKLSQKFSLWNEVQYRNYNLAGDLEQLLLRTALTYTPAGYNCSFSQGYAFVASENYSGTVKKQTEEHRIYQQIIFRQNYGRFFIQHRYRMEERFFPAQKLFKVRYRYFLSLNVPFNKKTIEPKAVYLSLYNEIFIGNNPSYYDRNRIYGALAYCFSKSVRVEAGAMTQILSASHRSQGMLTLFWSPDISKKEQQTK